MRRRTLDSLSDITGAVIRKADPKRRRDGTRAALVWEQIAGPEVARHTVAAGVREGELTVHVDSAAWAHQLDMMKDRYLESVRSEIGDGVVRSVRFTVSRRVAQERTEAAQVILVSEFYKPEPDPSIPLSDTERQQAEYVAGAVTDEGLREAALRVMIKDLEWKKGVRLRRESQARSGGVTGDSSEV